MFDDIYKDQIFLHPSVDWTPRFFNNLMRDLTPHGWYRKDEQPRISMDLYRPGVNKSLLVHVMHEIPPDLDLSKITLISDLVYRKRPIKEYLPLWPEVYGEWAHDFQYANTLPTKRFNCFINRGCRFRQSWMYQMVRMDLLDQGHVSYWCEDRFTNKSAADYFDMLFQGNEIFKQEHDILRDRIPFKNFAMPLEQAIIDSAVTVVIETWFDNNDIFVFSEKIWRSIQLPRPWLLFASQHSVNFLRDLGLDVFDDYVDHSYDEDPDPIMRQMKILSQLRSNRSLDSNHLQDLERRAESNRAKMRSWKGDWPAKYQKIVNRIVDISTPGSLTSRA